MRLGAPAEEERVGSTYIGCIYHCVVEMGTLYRQIHDLLTHSPRGPAIASAHPVAARGTT